MRVAELWIETVRDMRVVYRCHSRLPLAQRMGSNGKPEKVRGSITRIACSPGNTDVSVIDTNIEQGWLHPLLYRFVTGDRCTNAFERGMSRVYRYASAVRSRALAADLRQRVEETISGRPRIKKGKG
jgi:hypothetical protein